MWSPGAATATYGCCVLPGHRDPSGSVPATASTPAQDAGSPGPANWLALPELATRTTSWPSAYATAACRTGSQAAADVRPIPKGRLMIRAPCETAYRIPAAAVRTDAGPEPPTITGRILALGAMPTVPVPVPCPAITTAMAVPWPSSPTWISVSPLPPDPVRLAPGRTTPRRSGMLAWTPLSTSATVMPAPSVSGHTFRCTCQRAIHHSAGPGVGRFRPAWARPPGSARAAPADKGSPHAASRPADTATDSSRRRAASRLPTPPTSPAPYPALDAGDHGRGRRAGPYTLDTERDTVQLTLPGAGKGPVIT